MRLGVPRLFVRDLVAGDFNDRCDVFLLSLVGPDADGDGQWDEQEFVGGTDPTLPKSVLRLTRVAVNAPEGQGDAQLRVAVVEWQAAPERVYRVEFANSLEGAH